MSTLSFSGCLGAMRNRDVIVQESQHDLRGADFSLLVNADRLREDPNAQAAIDLALTIVSRVIGQDARCKPDKPDKPDKLGASVHGRKLKA